MNLIYAETYAEIQKVVDACNRAGDRGEIVGLDTEFYNVDVGKQNCYARAKVHFISLAVQRFPTQTTARGIPVCDAAVMLSGAFGHLPFVQWLESDYHKAVHNLPVDAHAIANHGITLGAGINTLAMARWAWPERARAGGFTLDALGQDLLRVGKTESFDELFSEEYEDLRSTYRKKRVCECGASPCRKRQSNPGHNRIIQSVETIHSSIKTRPVPLQSVVRGHALWDRALNYAAYDAVLALQIYHLALEAMQIERHVPWLA